MIEPGRPAITQDGSVVSGVVDPLIALSEANFARWLHLMRDSDGRFMVESPQTLGDQQDYSKMDCC